MADVSLRGLSKSFGETKVIKHVDLEIKEGEFVVFVGPSGCGKSTLLRLIAGLEDISSGDLFIDNTKVNNLPSLERGVGMVFQSYALYPHMSVEENMAFGLKLAKAPKKLINEKVGDAAKLLKLDQLLQRKPKALSGGQRQRVAIGRCIVREPKVFLFDEPLSNLDAALRVEMRIAIAKLHSDLKNTMIYVTHDQVEAMTLADKIVVLNAGEISQVGSPLELYHYPDNLFVAGFIGSPKMNFIDGKIADIGTDSITVSLPNDLTISVAVDTTGANVGDKVTLGIRPEDTVAAGEGDAVLKAPIIVEEHLGHESLIYLDVPNTHENFIVRLHVPPTLKAGEEMEVGIPSDQCHLFSADGKAFRRKFDASDIINNAKH